MGPLILGIFVLILWPYKRNVVIGVKPINSNPKYVQTKMASNNENGIGHLRALVPSLMMMMMMMKYVHALAILLASPLIICSALHFTFRWRFRSLEISIIT